MKVRKIVRLGLIGLLVVFLGFTVGCSRQGNTALSQESRALRIEVFDLLTNKVPAGQFSISVGARSVVIKKIFFRKGLEIIIINNNSSDKLRLQDYSVKYNFKSWVWGQYHQGVDYAYFNGYKNGLEGMDERFDNTLKIILPILKKEIKEKIESGKKNTVVE